MALLEKIFQTMNLGGDFEALGVFCGVKGERIEL